MTKSQLWEQLYRQTPLREVPHHFANLRRSPFLVEYLTTVLKHCPRDGRTLETGVGSGYGAIWLSRRSVCAEGLDYSPGIIERARQINNMLGGEARFRVGDLFQLYEEGSQRYDVIHHQGVLEHFTAPQIRAALAQQAASAHWVIFSVPSVYYPFDPEFGDERLLPLEEWRRLLEPFQVEELRYYGDPQLGGQEHVLCVLRGQKADDRLRAMMVLPVEPYPDGVSVIVHTRNEERHIGTCLETVKEFADEIIVCDMESTDRTVEIARTFGAEIVEHPKLHNFDRARNVSAMRAKYRWIVYLDADERMPPGLGPALKQKIAKEGDSFEAMLLPFRHGFAGHFMQCLYPGYTAPRLLKNGRFVFRSRLHAGVDVDGRTTLFPSDNPDLALIHYSFDSLSHYLEKLSRYTDGESESMHRDGQAYHWQRAIAHFVEDFQAYYDRGRAWQDGVHGFLYSFLSGFYRFEQHAKLYEKRFHNKQLQPDEEAVPASVEQVLEFALAVARQKPRVQAAPIRVEEGTESHTKARRHEEDREEKEDDKVAVRREGASGTEVGSCSLAGVVWSGPLLDPSGYGEESRNFLFALEDAGVDVAAHSFPWSDDVVECEPVEAARLEKLRERRVRPGFVQIVQDFPNRFQRHLQAGIAIGRTMFETDRLPGDWVEGCNRMDYIWVPSEFNRRSFADAGVATEKLVVIPGCLDPTVFDAEVEETALVRELREGGRFLFLSVFDWTRHKGWDVLLRGFLETFPPGSGVTLVLKVWSTNGYSSDQIRGQAAEYVKCTLGVDLEQDDRVRFVFEKLSRTDLIALYRGCDAFVLPSRGEGWGRPYMEAMACGLPTIGTNWSGDTAFMTEENSYLIDCAVVPVPEAGWRELPTYRGHRWAEPEIESLKAGMLRVVSAREEAAAKGSVGRAQVREQFSRAQVGALMAAEIERVRGGNKGSREGAKTREEENTAAHEGTKTQGEENVGAHEGTKALRENGKSGGPTERLQGKRGESFGQDGRNGQDEDSELGRIGNLKSKVENRKSTLRLEGSAFMWHSLAHVNRELALGLLGSGRVEMALVPTEPNQFDPGRFPNLRPLMERAFAPLSRPADVHVRHFFPPRFERPDEGKLVLIQPWEYGYLPKAWIEPICENADEVWCYSEYVRQVYLASGIPEERLHVVPLGVDTEVFRPDAPPYVFTTEAGVEHAAATLEGRFVFLFVGGTLHRKGIDILLEAFQKAFSAYDEVCLVIKDTGTKTVYQGQNERERILALSGDPSRPAVIYLDDDLPAAQLAGLYTASDCVVLPYRGEGFCLPALEALACGVPVIVPEGGPTDDFVDERVGWRVAAERRPFGNSRVGDWECAGPTWMLEIAPQDLGRQMRQVFQSREEARRRGEAGAKRVAGRGGDGWTWEATCDKALGRIEALQDAPTLIEPVREMGRKEDRHTKARSHEEERMVAHAEARRRGEEEAGSHTKTRSHEEEAPRKLPGQAPTRHAKGAEETAQSSSDRRASAGLTAPKRTAPSLSLCMIVKNEERVLDACLTSVKPHVDEIIVVDTGSTDRTIEIAQSHGVKLYHFPWCDDFSAARNVSLSHASGDWVIWLDADDTLPEECGRQLRDLILLAETDITGYIMQVHIPPAPGDHGFTIVDHVKIFRNRPEHRFEGRIHEQILEPLYRTDGKIERTNLYVVHSGYDYSPEGQKKKRERDLRILALDVAARPNHPFPRFNVGMTHHHLKNFDTAIEALEKSLSLSKPHESTVRKIYAMLASCHMERGEPERARERIEQGLALTPHDPELLFRGGAVYRTLGDMATAEQCYLHLLTARETGHIDSLDVSMTGFKAHHNLALLYQEMQRWSEAETQWKAAVASNARFLPSWLGLAELYLRLRRYEDARSIAEQLREWAPDAAAELSSRLTAFGPS